MSISFGGQGTSTSASSAANFDISSMDTSFSGMGGTSGGAFGGGGQPQGQSAGEKYVKPTGSAWSDIATGATNAIMSFVDKKKKREEQRLANKEYGRTREAYTQLDTSNPFGQLENPYEDLTINKQEAEFQAQQEQQAMANTMQAMQGAAGGSGIAGLAQAMANQQSRNLQRASADIGRQERENLLTEKAFTARRQEQGVVMERQMKREQAETMFGMAQQRKASADEAMKGTIEGLVGGLNQIGAGVGGLFMPQGV